MKIWLVNDHLTCIPGTSTFWHNLLDWFPEIEDKTGHDFSFLPTYIEQEAERSAPDLIIRNASYFRPLNLNVPTISLLQDITDNISVLSSSNIIVTNSEFTLAHYPSLDRNKVEVIPLGVDFDFFRPLPDKEALRQKWGIRSESICFIGSRHDIKGWPRLREIILQCSSSTDWQFVLILKDDQPVDIPTHNYKEFHRVNHDDLLEIVNACDLGICTSTTETQHLAGIEMGACGIPIVASNVGVYYNRETGDWGCRYNDPISAIEWMLMEKNLDPRKYWLGEGLDLKSCKNKWEKVIRTFDAK